jgi:chromosome segregation ATPase
MHEKKINWPCIVCIAAVAAVLVLGGFLVGLQNHYHGSLAEIANLEGQLGEAQAAVRGAEAAYHDLRTSIDRIREDRDALNGQLERIRDAVADLAEGISASENIVQTSLRIVGELEALFELLEGSSP